jgi:hypothetical protein
MDMWFKTCTWRTHCFRARLILDWNDQIKLLTSTIELSMLKLIEGVPTNSLTLKSVSKHIIRGLKIRIVYLDVFAIHTFYREGVETIGVLKLNRYRVTPSNFVFKYKRNIAIKCQSLKLGRRRTFWIEPLKHFLFYFYHQFNLIKLKHFIFEHLCIGA